MKKKNYRLLSIELAKQIAKKRDNFTCLKCGRSKEQGWQIHAAHIIPVSQRGVTVCDPENIKALCSVCHRWWHDNPFLASKWFEGAFPGLYDGLYIKNKSATKPDFKELFANLKALVNKKHTS